MPRLGWLPLVIVACGGQGYRTQPSAPSVRAPVIISLEGEPGSGHGHVLHRSQASGGQTIHLGPAESRRWIFTVSDAEVPYAVWVTYSNGEEGQHEIISLTVDDTEIASFQDRNTAGDLEGWNVFVTDAAGKSVLRVGNHALVLNVTGGDGCVEIDRVTLIPDLAEMPRQVR